MPFSPDADLVGGVVVTATGVDVLRHVDQRRSLVDAEDDRQRAPRLDY